MDQKSHRADFAADILAIPAINTINLDKEDTLKELRRYLRALNGVASEYIAEVCDEVRSEAPCFLGSEKIAPCIFEALMGFDETGSAIEAAEENAAEAYVLEAAE